MYRVVAEKADGQVPTSAVADIDPLSHLDILTTKRQIGEDARRNGQGGWFLWRYFRS